MKQPISKLKEWFGVFKMPTASNFSDWIDSFWHKDAKIPAANIEGWSDNSAVILEPGVMELPDLTTESKNKNVRVFGGPNGRKYTYKGTEFPIEANHEAILVWDGTLKIWKIQDSVPMATSSGVVVINPVGTDLPQERAVASYVQPLKSKFVESGEVIVLKNFGGFNSWTYDTGTFSGFGTTFGVVKNFSKIQLYHKARVTNATLMKVRICETDMNGAVLYSGEVAVNLPNGQVGDIDVDLGKVIKNDLGKVIWVEWYANGNIGLPRANQLMDVPRKVYYKSGGSIATNFAESNQPSSANETRETFVRFWGPNGNLIASEGLSNEVLSKGAAPGKITENETKAVAGREVYVIKKSLSEITKLKFIQDNVEFRGLTTLYYVSNTFRGWGQLIGVVPNLGKITFIVRTVGGATTVNFIIRDGGPNGAILMQKTITGSFPNASLIKVSVLTEGVDITKSLFVQYSTNGYIALPAGQNPTDFDDAHRLYYTTGSLSDNVATAASDKKLQLYFELGTGHYVSEISDSVIEQVKAAIVGDPIPDPAFLLTSKVWLYKGKQYSIPYKNLVIPDFGDNLENYRLDFNGPSVGYQLERLWRTVGGTTGNNNYSLSVSLMKGRKILATKIQNVLCAELTNGQGLEKDILYIGDSTGEQILQRLKALLDADPAMTFKYLGTLGTTVKHESRGGATHNTYFSAGTIYYRINVAGLITNPAIDSVYGQDQSRYTVKEVNITDGVGYFSVAIASGTAPVLSAGTLIKISGEGQDTINYNSADITPANPFFNPTTQAFDLGHYLASTGQILRPGGWVVFGLGINDTFGITSLELAATSADTMMYRLRFFVDAIHAYDPTIKVAICITPPPSLQSGFASNYYNGQMAEMYKTTGLVTWQKKLISEYDNDATRSQKTFLVSGHLTLDGDYNYPFSIQPPNAEYSGTGTETMKVQSNGVHPAPGGSEQIAKMIAGLLKYEI